MLTDLRGTGSMLVFPASAAGRFFVRDSGERLVAELRKQPGRPLELALDPGGYRVTREEEGRLVEARVSLLPGRSELPGAGFSPVPRERTALRGDEVEELAKVAVDLSIFPPVSLNGDRDVVNRLQLGLIASRTTRLRGLGLAPVLWADEDVKGVQLATVGSSARGGVSGAQISSVANVAGALRGVQLTQGLNLVRGDAVGWQHGLANWTSGPVTGFQSGVVNYSSAVTGAQLGPCSVTSALSGAQVGLLNVGGDVQGAQVGLVNVARHARGAQVGLVNIADTMEGAPLGLLSIVGDGDHALLVLGDENGIASAELALGSRWFHSILSAGVQRSAGGERLWTGFGVGVHHARGRLLLDVDVVSRFAVNESQEAMLLTARLLPGWQLGDWIALVAGPSVSWFRPGGDLRPGLGGLLERRGEDGTARVWLGVTAGLRLGRR